VLALALRFGRFGLVGASGLVVNTVLLAALAELGGMHYLLAAIVATQGSSAWNLLLTERWVFSGREHRRGAASRAVMFFAVNNAALLLRAPMLVALTEGLGIGYLVSNLVTLMVLVIARFTLADTWIWAGARVAIDTPGARPR
jgi:dolichol-phosphate mannosyltransferase